MPITNGCSFRKIFTFAFIQIYINRLWGLRVDIMMQNFRIVNYIHIVCFFYEKWLVGIPGRFRPQYLAPTWRQSHEDQEEKWGPRGHFWLLYGRSMYTSAQILLWTDRFSPKVFSHACHFDRAHGYALETCKSSDNFTPIHWWVQTVIKYVS